MLRVRVRVRFSVNCNNYNPAKIIISNRVAQIIWLSKLFLSRVTYALGTSHDLMATDTYVNFLKFLHVLRGMISDDHDRARTKYKYMEYASMKICYFRVRHVRTYARTRFVKPCWHKQHKIFLYNIILSKIIF